jgi:hypothetical protein
MVLGEYQMDEIAREFGPGRYLLKPGPGQYRAKSATLNISEQYARANGWRELPPMPRRETLAPSDAFVMDRMQRGTQAPMSQLDMGTMMELAISKALAAQNANRPQVDPVAPIMSGFELALTMMEKAKGIVNPAAMLEKEPLSLAEVALQHAPDILSILKQGLTMLAAPAPAAAAAAPAPAGLKVVNPNPEPAPVQVPAHEEPLKMPDLTQEQIDAINPIMSVLHEFAPKLIGFLNSPMPADMLGGQLAGMIGPDLEASALALSDLVELHGPNLLGNRFRELGTEKAGAVVRAMARKLREDWQAEP